ERKVIDQRVVQAVSRADRGLSFSKRIPRQRDSRREQLLRVVFRVYRFADDRIGQKNAIRIGDVVRGAAVLFIPTVRELMAQTDAEREVPCEPHGILGVPGTEPASET